MYASYIYTHSYPICTTKGSCNSRKELKHSFSVVHYKTQVPLREEIELTQRIETQHLHILLVHAINSHLYMQYIPVRQLLL